jgi:hypothetical protein
MNLRRRLPWIWTGLIGVVAVLLDLWSYGATGMSQLDAALGVLVLLPLMLITALGSFLSIRQPGNRIAWLLHLISVVLLLSLWTERIVQAGQPEYPKFLDYFAVVVQNAIAPTMVYAVFLLLFLFPTGTFISRSWSWAWWVSATYFSVLTVVATFSLDVGPVYAKKPWSMENPIGFLPNETLTFMGAVLVLLLLAVAVGGIASIVVRYRRADLIVRTQIKWVLLAAVVSVTALPIGISELEVLSSVFMMIVITAVPVAVTLAISRYKLFEIDRLISRSISYAIVVLLLGAVFAAGAVWLPAQFLGGQSSILVAASTLAVAALFSPVRARVQRLVDRRFNRTSYQAEMVSEEFAARLQEAMTIEQLEDAWARTVDIYFEPTFSGIWLRHSKDDQELR